MLKRWLDLSESETALKRAVKEQEAALDKLAYDKYPKLTEAEIKTLVVDDKWMARLVGRRAGRTGARLADPHRPHPRAGRTLRHAAAAAHGRGGDACRTRGGTPQAKMGASWK